MKKVILLSALFFLSFCLNAQIHVGLDLTKKMKDGTFSSEELNLLKSTTTIFVYDNKYNKNKEELENALKEVWTFNNIEIITANDLRKYTGKKNYSFISVVKDVTTTTNTQTGFTTEYIHFYFSLWMYKSSKKIQYGRIELFPKFSTIDDQYPVFNNLSNGCIIGYLRILNDYLLQNKTRWMYQDEENNPAIKTLKNDTLFIPDYVLIKFNSLNGDESKKHDPKDLLDDYPFPYKIVTNQELSKKILNSTAPVNYLIFIRSSAQKYITVYNSKSGLIYNKFTNISYNIKSDDFEDLAKRINKIKS